MKKALLIVDVQNDYFPDGKCRLHKPEEALNTIKGLLKSFREPNTEGVQIHKDIKPLDTEAVIVKHYPNSFYETDLHNELMKNEVTELVVCGMMTHMCIDTTVRAAKEYGYKVTLISDGCAAKALEWNGVRIPADTVQDVFMASLNRKVADVITSVEPL